MWTPDSDLIAGDDYSFYLLLNPGEAGSNAVYSNRFRLLGRAGGAITSSSSASFRTTTSSISNETSQTSSTSSADSPEVTREQHHDTSGHKHSLGTGGAAGLGIGIALAVGALAVLAFWWWKKKRTGQKQVNQPQSELVEANYPHSRPDESPPAYAQEKDGEEIRSELSTAENTPELGQHWNDVFEKDGEQVSAQGGPMKQ